MSDHRYVHFEIRSAHMGAEGRKRKRELRWAVSRIDKERLCKYMRGKSGQDKGANEEAEGFTKKLRGPCDIAILKKREYRGRSTYWWNEAIAEARRQANEARRDVTRCRRRGGDMAAIEEALEEAKARLKTEISLSKRAKWRELQEEVEGDRWGRPYRIVAKKLGRGLQNVEALVPGGTKMVVRTLFTRKEERELPGPWMTPTDEEVTAANALPGRKAVGPGETRMRQ